MMLDLPQPLGPTTPTMEDGKENVVGSTKDLNPESFTQFSRIYASSPIIGSLIASDRTAMPDDHTHHLETFENPQPDADYTIRMHIPEFTCLCPLTGQPDFAEFLIEYVPDKLCVELKALKLYMSSFRSKGLFHEAITNRILIDIAALLKPRFMRITADFNVRGGIYTQVIAEHRQDGWQAETPVILPSQT